MRKITFRQIETFRAVMETGSMSGGAQVLGLTQPAVSRSVRDLEANLELRLFSRNGNSIKPTADAALLVQEVEAQFGGLDRIEEAAIFIRNAKKGTMRIAAMTAATTRFLPFILSTYLDKFPRAQVTLKHANPRSIIESLTNKRADIGFTHFDGQHHPALEIEMLPMLSPVAILPATHPLAKKQAVFVEDLANEALLSFSEDSVLWEQFTGVLKSKRIRPEISCAASASETLYTLAVLGKGIAIVEPFTTFGRLDPRIVVRPILPRLDYPVCIVFPKADSRPRPVMEFAALIREAVGGLAREIAVAQDAALMPGVFEGT